MTRRLRATGAAALLSAAMLAWPAASATATTPQRVGPDDWAVQPAGVASVFTGGPALDEGIGLWRNGTLSADVVTTVPARRLVVDASADRCSSGAGTGGAWMEVAVDGVKVFWGVVDADEGRYTVPGRWLPGRHTIEVSFVNDYRSATCDRNLKVWRAWLDDEDAYRTGAVWLYADSLIREAEDAGKVFNRGLLGQPVQLLWRNADVTGTFTVPSDISRGRLTVELGSHFCGADARAALSVNDTFLGITEVRLGGSRHLGFYEYPLPDPLSAGQEVRVTVSFTGDYRTETCDRNLLVGAIGLHKNG